MVASCQRELESSGRGPGRLISMVASCQRELESSGREPGRQKGTIRQREPGRQKGTIRHQHGRLGLVLPDVPVGPKVYEPSVETGSAVHWPLIELRR